MKTVCVFATLKLPNVHEFDVMEHSIFGENCAYESAAEFISSCKDMWSKTCNSYKITNVVIG